MVPEKIILAFKKFFLIHCPSEGIELHLPENNLEGRKLQRNLPYHKHLLCIVSRVLINKAIINSYTVSFLLKTLIAVVHPVCFEYHCLRM